MCIRDRSYADIFFNNSFKNGLLPIVLSELEVARLFDEIKALSLIHISEPTRLNGESRFTA